MFRFASCAGALTLLFSSGVEAAPPPAVQSLLMAYSAAWARADGSALGQYFTPDGELSTPYGVNPKGPAAIGQFYSAAFARGYAGSQGSAELEEAKQVSPDVIFVRGHWSIRGAKDKAGGARPAECGPFFAALRREDGAWRIVALHELGGACPAEGSR